MTKTEFLEVIKEAKKRVKRHEDGDYTCCALSDSVVIVKKKGMYDSMHKLRQAYADLFGFGFGVVVEELLVENSYTKQDTLNIRLNCLELFKASMLQSKEYEGIRL